MVFECPRGVRDFGPERMGVRRHVEDSIGKVFSSFGYRQVGTPTFEFVELFEAKSGPEIMQHLYVFEDKGGRRLCLRPEATASVARMYASELRSLPKPLRLSYSGPMFRYEEPQKGRYREFWQAGVELFGAKGPQADSEAITLVFTCLEQLGLRFRLRISHIGVLRTLLSAQGFDEAGTDKIIQLLDKGDMKSVREKVKDSSFMKLMELSGSADVIKEAASIVAEEKVKELLSELSEVLALLDSAGVGYEVDFGMARGLDYYTGIVFDARAEGLGAQDQICGGGRYDDLVELFGGPATPAVGFAFGIDRIIEAMTGQGVEAPGRVTDVYVASASEAVRPQAFRIAVQLRKSNSALTIDHDISGRRLNRALQHASEQKARFAVIVGERELAKDSVVLKDMASQKQEEVRIKDLAERLA